MVKEFKPGIYDISNEDYHSSFGISRSGIMELRRSPIHFWHKYINTKKEPEKETQAKIFGNAVHTAILEPDTFLNRYCIIPKVDRRTKEGKEIYSQFCAANIGKTILTEDDYIVIMNIYKSISESNIPEQLIKGAQYEKSIFWVDSETGITCKCRPDILHSHFIVDLKTTTDASYRAFQSDLYHYGYHIQAAMIREGVKESFGKDMQDFIFLAIEKESPYVPGIYQLDQSALDRGHNEFKKYLKIYKECIDKNDWPGYPIERISLPAYAT